MRSHSREHLGFTVVDFSTGAALSACTVVIPRPMNPPSSPAAALVGVRLGDKQTYFETGRNGRGDIIVVNVPAGMHEAVISAHGYITARVSVTSPMIAPRRVHLHRDPSYQFGAHDTLILGEVVRASKEPYTGHDITFHDLVEPDLDHKVPLNPRGQFVVFVPRKRKAGAAEVIVPHASGPIKVPLARVDLGRPNIARNNSSNTIVVP